MVFPAKYSLMTRKTRALASSGVCSDARSRPGFVSENIMPDFERCPSVVVFFQEIFGIITISGCWFHYLHAVLKLVNKLRLKEDYTRTAKDIIRCILCNE